jgi:hypothetical protein
MTAAGISPSDFDYVNFIINHEGGWDGTTKWNYGGSGAYGLCQSLPANKMAAAGPDWETNPVTQLKWCDGHAKGYGGWQAAYYYWLDNNYW